MYVYRYTYIERYFTPVACSKGLGKYELDIIQKSTYVSCSFGFRGRIHFGSSVFGFGYGAPLLVLRLVAETSQEAHSSSGADGFQSAVFFERC